MWYNYEEIPFIKPKNNLIGKVFGNLKVLAYTRKITPKGPTGYWVCKCSCGNNVDIRGNKILERTGCHSCSCSNSYRNKKGGKYITIPNYSKLKRLYNTYKRRAKLANLSFKIDEDFFIKTVNKDCHYCGSPPIEGRFINVTLSDKDGQFKVNGIDRKNSSKGYEESNCVACCSMCNYSKKEYTEKDWYDWIKRLCNFNN